jgi:hypothetical protein
MVRITIQSLGYNIARVNITDRDFFTIFSMNKSRGPTTLLSRGLFATADNKTTAPPPPPTSPPFHLTTSNQQQTTAADAQ